MHRKNPSQFLNACYAAPACAQPPELECCPLCSGAYDGKNLNKFIDDPSSPTWIDPDVLAKEAIAAFQRLMAGTDEELDFIRMGTVDDDGEFTFAGFSVDRNGDVSWIYGEEQTLVTRIPADVLAS